MDQHKHITKEYAAHAAYYDERWAGYNRVSSAGTLQAVAQCLSSTDEGAPISLLDIACGTGLLLAQIHKTQPAIRLFGVDLSAQMLTKAQQRLGPKVDLQQSNAEQLPFPEQQFDIAVCNSATQYFTDLNRFFTEAHRVLKPGGQLVITVWARDALIANLHYRWLCWRHPAIQQILTTGNYAELIGSSGFQVLEVSRYNAGPLWNLATLRARKPINDN